MTTIELTHKNERIQMSESEAVGLHRALNQALIEAGIETQHHSTVAQANGVQCFVKEPALVQTDC